MASTQQETVKPSETKTPAWARKTKNMVSSGKETVQPTLNSTSALERKTKNMISSGKETMQTSPTSIPTSAWIPWIIKKIASSEKETIQSTSTRIGNLYDSRKVTVHPSSTSQPVSVWLTWPQSTNKVALTIPCPSYRPKVTFKTSDGFHIGMVEIKSFEKQLWIHCKEGGTKDWYGGNKLIFSTRSWGICRSGTTDTLIIERTALTLKIWRGDEVVFSRNWAATDGKCLSEAGFWRLQNFGNTVLSAWSILGKVYLIIILNLYFLEK